MIGKFSDSKEIRRLREIARDLDGKNITIPSAEDVIDARNQCESILSGEGRVNFEFARWVLIAWEWECSQKVKRSQSGQLLVDDI